MIRKHLFIIFFVFWLSVLSFPHGLKLEIEKRFPCILVAAMYHGGSVLSDAEVKVSFYGRQEEFQKGRTDKNGKFSFIPDKEGTWYVQVDDGMGHKKKKKIEIGTDFFQDKAARDLRVGDHGPPVVDDRSLASADRTPGGCIYCKVLLGVVLIFALAFILYILKRKGEGKRQV